MQIQELFPGTVCCILCRGMVIYKDGDKARFTAHMANEHGAFFDISYLLASSLMEDEQKAAVARVVEGSDANENELFEHESKKPKLQEASKGRKKERFSCTTCEKTYGSKQRLNVHTENSHANLVGSFKEQEMKMLAENTLTDLGGSFSIEDEHDENMENGPVYNAGLADIKEDTLIEQTKYEDRIGSNSTMEAFKDSQGFSSEESFSADADYQGTNLASSEMEHQEIYSTPSLNEYSANLNTNLDDIKESAVNGDKQPKTILCVLCD